MKILKKPELKSDGIYVEAELDGDLIIRKFPKNKDAEDIKKELLASEENIKQDKLNKVKYEQKQKDDAEALKTIESLIS